MNPVAMMMQMPMMQTAKIEAANKHPLLINGETQSFSNFSKLFQEQGEAPQVETADIGTEAGKAMLTDEMIEELLKLEVKEMEEILTKMMSKQELSEEDLSIIEPFIQMGSSQFLKDMIEHYKQPKYQEYIARALPIGDPRIIERINEDGTLVLRPTDPVDEEKNIKLQPMEPFNDFSKVQQEAKQVLNQVEHILNNIHSADDVPKAAPRVLELLQQWQKLVVQTGPDADKLKNLNLEDKQLSGIWKQLVQVYQNRIGIHSQNYYNLDAKVTANDIARWLGNAMESTVQTEKQAQQIPVAAQPMPVSKVEQFMIHLNQPQQTQPVDKQLVEQFQKIMDANRITNLQNGRGQLAITLKPHNLGEMLVRFTQVNGEMMVKILVTSESAQKMLEGNIQQLRSMFSPHQVVIDRQETILTENQESQKHQERNDQQGTREEAHPEEQQQKQGNESFSNIFEELIVNEEV